MRTHSAILMLGLCLVAQAADTPAPSVPSASEALERTQKAVPQLSRTESEHYVLLSDAPLDHAQHVTRLLESTLKSFYANCDAMRLEASQPRHKLVAVLFREKSDFAAFAKSQDGMQNSWAAGYYSPTVDRLVMFDAMSNDTVKQAMGKLKNNEQRVAQQARGAGAGALDAGGVGGQAARINQQIQAQKHEIASAATDSFVGTVTHEAAHQLFFHSGVQKRGVTYPLWLAEGLATGFEASDTADADLGFQSDNPKRRAAMTEALQGDRLIPLRVLVSKDRYVSGTNSQEGELKDFYGQSCIFTMWLARSRPTELRRYLEALKQGAYAMPSKREENFEAIFGPIDSLERVWLRAEGRKWPGLAATPWGKRLNEFDQETPKPDAAAKATAAPVTDAPAPGTTTPAAGTTPPAAPAAGSGTSR
jgi:hypothetical protein